MIKVENIETWGSEHAIRNHPEYKVTKNGEIIGKRNQIMTGMTDKCGYKEVVLSEDGKQKNYLVHRLVLSTFNPVDDMENLDVNHINGIKTDNRIENLEWCTRSENILHAYKTGLEKKVCGENHHAHKLTKENVEYIRRFYKKRHKEFGAVALSKKFNVDRTTIHDIIRNKTWKEVQI